MPVRNTPHISIAALIAFALSFATLTANTATASGWKPTVHPAPPTSDPTSQQPVTGSNPDPVEAEQAPPSSAAVRGIDSRERR